jgi:protein translocase SEC61 complex gamma subunit
MAERIRSFLSQCVRMLKIATKPSKSELWLSIKICFLGIIVIGAIGYIIQLLSSLIQGPLSGTPT